MCGTNSETGQHAWTETHAGNSRATEERKQESSGAAHVSRQKTGRLCVCGGGGRMTDIVGLIIIDEFPSGYTGKMQSRSFHENAQTK